MMEGELQEEQWELIAPLLPKHKRRGIPPAEDRRTRSAPPAQLRWFYLYLGKRAHIREPILRSQR